MIDEYDAFVEKIKIKTSIDLSLYKQSQMKRRLTSLYEKRFSSFFEYYRAMSSKQRTA